MTPLFARTARRVAALLGLAAMLLPGPAVAAQAAPVGTASTSERVDLNTATVAELAALPGMGREYARRVIVHRPYSAKNQLVTRGILPEAAYAAVAPYVIAHRVTKK